MVKQFNEKRKDYVHITYEHFVNPEYPKKGDEGPRLTAPNPLPNPSPSIPSHYRHRSLVDRRALTTRGSITVVRIRTQRVHLLVDAPLLVSDEDHSKRLWKMEPLGFDSRCAEGSSLSESAHWGTGPTSTCCSCLFHDVGKRVEEKDIHHSLREGDVGQAHR